MTDLLPRGSARALGLLLLTTVVALTLFHQTARGMVDIWIVSATFTHAFLVPPIAAWLAWRRRAALVGVPVRPAPWVLLPLAGACFLWLLGDLAEVAAASQFALVSVLVLSVPALFGWAVARVLAFPLLFLFFAVPIGEFAVPTLQQWTADVTVMALRATGIPVYRDGNQFIIPTGVWSVIEACSGVRYLIACVMVGTLFAYLNYRSLRRRLLFMAASVVVPILANWIRAYTIVMIGHLTGSPMILGVEHTTYGWYLFGVVVLLLFFVGARWSEPDAPPSPVPAVAVAPAPVPWGMALALLALLAATQAWSAHLGAGAPLPAPRPALPEGQAGWQRQPGPDAPAWPPAFKAPSAEAAAAYVQDGREVRVWIAYYRQQDQRRKLVSSVNHVVDPEDKHWAFLDGAPLPAAADRPAFRTGVVRQGSAPSLVETPRQRVWQVYWVGGRWVAGDIPAKLWQALDGLTGRGDDGAVLLLSTDAGDDADAALEKFARAHLSAMDAALRAARDTR